MIINKHKLLPQEKKKKSLHYFHLCLYHTKEFSESIYCVRFYIFLYFLTYPNLLNNSEKCLSACLEEVWKTLIYSRNDPVVIALLLNNGNRYSHNYVPNYIQYLRIFKCLALIVVEIFGLQFTDTHSHTFTHEQGLKLWIKALIGASKRVLALKHDMTIENIHRLHYSPYS